MYKYDFSNGKWDYNERTFIGFGKVRTIPLNNAGGSGIGETVTYYHQSNDKAGKPYRTEIYAQGASSPISVSEITYQNDGSAPYFTPITKQVSMQDGISTTVEFEQFDANNGQPKRTIQKNVPVYENGITTYKDRVVENAFAYEQNGALATEHRYSEISEVKTRDSDGNLLSHKKTIYTSQNATEKFLPNEEQIWDKDRNQWITVSKIVKRDNFGTPIETQDIDGISSSTILGHKGRFPIASFGNAAHHEVFADDFNDGSLWDSDPTTWTTAGEWQASNGTANARTSGARMLYAPTQTPPQSLLQNFIAEFDFKINTAGSAQDWCGFVFRGNTNVAQGFDISGGYLVYFRQNGSVEVMPSNGNMVSTYSPKSIVRGTAMWNRAKLLVQGNVLTIFVNGEFFYSLALGGANVGTTFGFEGHGANFEIDNFRLYPANAFASSQSINPKTLLTEHATDAQGVRSFTEYDEFRVPIETRNNEGLVMSTRYYSFSRETNGNYNPSTPNTSTSLSYQYGNPILNASFETRDSVGKAMWDTYPYRSPKHWTWEYNLYAANYYGDGVTGKGYMYLRASQNNGYVHTFLSKPDYLKGSTTYKISFWAKSNPYGQSTSPMKIYLMKVSLDSAYQVWAFSSLQIGTTWQKYTLTLSTNADPKWNNPQYLSVFRFDVDRMYDIVYLDDVQIEEEGKSLNASLTKSFSDGLGRTLQTQAFDASSNQWIVSAQHDDSFGRPTRAYRPFEANTNGAFTITIPSNQGYTETTYYNDPLSRTKDQKPIGATGGASTSINEWVTTEYGAEGNLRVTSTHSPYDNTGRTVSKAYTDAYGRAIKTITNVSESGALKLFTETDYDIQDRPTRTIDPNGFTDVGARNGQFQSTMHYDFLGNMKSKTSPDAGTAEYIYDRAGRLRFSRNAKQAALNQFSYFAYDNLGKLIEEGYGYHNPSDWNINSYSSVLQQLADNSKSWPRELNPATWRKRYIYDEIGTTPFAKGALVRVETNNDDNADSDVIEQYQYDQYGRTTEKAIQVLDYNDQPKTTRYVYDDAGQVRRVIYPTITSSGGVPSERTVTAFSFSGAHTVEAQDSLRTSGAVKAESGSQVMFRAGKRIRLQSGFHAKAGTRFRAKIEPPSASGSGMEITYAYNNLGELIAIGNGGDADYFARYTYNSDGGLAEEWLNNGTATFKRRFEYEAYRGRLTGISGSFFTQSVGYGAYLNGNIAATTYTYPNFSGLNNAYSAITYDRLGRLKKADNVQNAYDVGAINELTYDKNGNIVRLQRGTGGTVNYVYQAGTNKVTSLTSGKTYQYDAVGNITRSSDKAAQGIGYDPFTQMTTEVKPSAAERVGFKYDSANERVMKLWENKSVMPAEMEATLYLHGLSDYPLSEKIDDGNRVYERQYVYGLQGLICVVEGGSETYIFKDHLGSTRAAIDKTGAFGEGYAYDALGKRIASARFGIGTANYPRYFYTGQEYDEETGLHNFRTRLYDDELFRFYATDPAGQFHSPYAFVGNSPLVYVDKDGQLAWFVPILIGAAISGASYTVGTALSPGGLSNWNWGNFAKSVGIGAVSGAFSAGIGNAFGAVGSGGLLGELGRAAAHGLSNMTVQAAFGNELSLSHFATGAGGSLLGSATHGLGDVGQIAASAMFSGGVSALGGGNFWQGLATGAITSTLNHAAHGIGQGGGDDPPVMYDEDGQAYVNINGQWVPMVSPLDLLMTLESPFATGYSALKAGIKGLLGKMGEKLFLSEKFGVTSKLFANKITGLEGAWNKVGSTFKAGWSTTGKQGGGMVFRIGIGKNPSSPNQALYHINIPGTFVPNSFSNPSIQVKQSLFNYRFQRP